MSAKAFLDTNVLVYAATGREAHPPKFRRAREIVASADVGISTQVIGEFVDNVQKARKMPRPLTLTRWRNGWGGSSVSRLSKWIAKSSGRR